LLAWDLLEGVTRAQPEPAVEIRRATAADVSSLAAVFATADLPDRFWGRSFEDLEDLRHPALWASDVPASGGLQQTCWVAVEGDTIVGAIVTRIDSTLNQAAGRRDGYFDRGGVAVLPAHRSRAIRQRLVLAGLDHFRAQGLARGLTWAYSPLEGDTPAITLCHDCGARELACHMAWEIDWPG
jgi:ribosomal protein S18 acetylase RimI-like enzyme